MSISLYVETDGQADSPEAAIAEAAIDPSSIPFEEGDVIEVKIEATWTTPDGKHHAKVSLVKQSNPKLTDGDKGLDKSPSNEEQDLDDEPEQVSGNHEYAADDNINTENQLSKDDSPSDNVEEALAAVVAAQNVNQELTDVSSESPKDLDIVVAHDGLTDNDPKNLESSALELTPDMAAAEMELEHDFAESRDPNSQRSRDLKDEPSPEEGYNSEGLRRGDEPAPGKKNKPEETPN